MIKQLRLVKESLKDVKEGLLGLTERIVLLSIICCVWTFLYLFQYHLPSFFAILILIALMSGYLIYMYLADKHRNRHKGENIQKLGFEYKPLVSIMIPAHNEQDVIRETVENILEMEYDKFEVIVIDDRSEDDTKNVLYELEREYEKVKVLIRDKDAFPGKSAVLNEAMQFAAGEAILVFDADARVKPDFLSNLIKPLSNGEIGAVQARKVIINRNHNLLTQCQDNELALDTHFQVGRDAVKGAVELRGNGELIRREALEDINGWNNYTITDDLDMSTRLHIKGWDIRFCPDVCVYEEGVVSVFALLKQRRRWVEGSIRRYLEQFKNVIFSKKMSLRARVDMTAYITEFLLPFSTISEFGLQLLNCVQHKPQHILASICIGVVICIFFMSGVVYGIRRYNNLSMWQSIKQGAQTGIYLFFLWFPLVIYIVFKIVFCKKTMDWGKTVHGLVTTEEKQLVKS